MTGVVADTSPLVALHQISLLRILPALFGVTEAVSLAVEIGATRLVVDDLQARRLATKLGLPIIGTTGLLLAAKQRGIIPSVREPLGALLDLGFRLHPDVQRAVLVTAGEVVP